MAMMQEDSIQPIDKACGEATSSPLRRALRAIPLANLHCLCLVLALISFFGHSVALPVDAQEAAAVPQGKCTIRGVVVNGKQQVANAHVSLAPRSAIQVSKGTMETESDASGEFVFSGLQAGAYRLTAVKSGHESLPVDVDVSPEAGQQTVRLVLTGSGPQHRSPAGSHSTILPMQFADEPNFKVAGITDWTAVGGHGSDAILRTSESLARETLKLKGREATPVKERGPEADLRSAVAGDPESFSSNHELGELLLSKREFPKAVLFLLRAQQIHPDDVENGEDLARAYEGAGHLASARKLVDQLIAREQSARLYRLAGEIDERLGKPLAAVEEYQAAVRLKPSEENYFDWGSELLYHRAVWQALEVFREGVAAYPRSLRMLVGLGAAQFGGALYDRAAMSFCKASDMAPEDPKPYSLMGKVELASPDPLPCVRSRLARFAHEHPGSALANYLYAMAILKRHELATDPKAVAEAETLLEKAVSLNHNYADAYLQLGILAYSRHNVQQAIGYYKQAIAADPQLAEAHYRLGVAYGRQGKADEARQQFQMHDELEKLQAAAVETRRKEIKQFQIVQEGMPALPAKP